MNKKLATLFWGVGLIAAGGLALLQTLGFVDSLTPVIWMTIFAGISLFSFVTYFTSGSQNWGLLFPAGIFAALALIILMATNGVDSAAVASPLFIAIAIPFVVVYLRDRSKNWWALIPTGVMAFLTLTLLVVDNVGGEWIGASLFFIISAAFFFVYLSSRTRTWAAIVAYILFVLGFMPLMALTSRPELAGILFLAGTSLPFLYVYFAYPKHWWALIPGGILLTTGIVTAVILLPGEPFTSFDNRVPGALILAGYAATFATIWRRHHQNWAMIVALVGICLSAGVLISAPALQIYWPFIIIAVGMYLLYRAIFVKPAQPSV
jgi:hypothetical protein